jgi:putative transposase
VAYPLSYRQLKEMMEERVTSVDHSTIHRWVLKYSPLLEAVCHRRKRPVSRSWRLDETYIRVKGPWKYLYRPVDKSGQTIDSLLTERRDERAALRFLTQAIRRHHVPHVITTDRNRANAAAITTYNAEHDTTIEVRQVRYLNNVVEQDHRAVKRVVRPTLGFTSMETAQRTLAGIEVMHMIKKGQMATQEGPQGQTPAQQFYSLAAYPLPPHASPRQRPKFATYMDPAPTSRNKQAARD